MRERNENDGSREAPQSKKDPRPTIVSLSAMHLDGALAIVMETSCFYQAGSSLPPFRFFVYTGDRFEEASDHSATDESRLREITSLLEREKTFMSSEQSPLVDRTRAEGKHTASHPPVTKLEVAPSSQKWSALLRKHVPFLLILCLAFFLLSINLTQPWVSENEDNGLAFSSIAVNYIRFGLGSSKGQNVADLETLNAHSPLSIAGVPSSQEFHYLLTGPVHPYVYADHPPLLGLTIAGALVVFGYHFWVVRMVPLAYSLATLILFYVLMNMLFDRGIALFASFLYATFPMMAYFGRDVAHEAPTLFWATVMLIGYVRWKSVPQQRRWLVLIVASLVIGGFYGWPMFYFAFIVFGIDWITSKRFSKALALATLVPAVLTFAVVIAQIFWALGDTLAPLILVFSERSVSNQYAAGPDNIKSWVVAMIHHNIDGYVRWSVVALPLSLLFIALRARTEGWSLRITILVITFLFGLSHILVFHGGAYFHVYWQFYFLPFYAMTIGWAATRFVREGLRWPKARIATLLVWALCIFVLNWPTIHALYSARSGVFVLPFGL